MDLSSAVVIGFFSLPSPYLAERNPSAYMAAMADAPRGAGSCQHCGTGIMHHVIIRLADGSQGFIGRDCANKVGSPTVRRCIRERITAEDLAAREAANAAWHKERWEERERVEAERQATLEVRFESLRDIIEPLESKGTEFHASLASQLRKGSLSHRQAEYAAKAVVGRSTKRTAAQWDAVYNRCVEDTDE